MRTLFAYGTLKDALQRQVVLRGASARVIGSGTVTGALYEVGYFPGLVCDGAGDPIPGVLLELSDDTALEHLDAYEDVAGGLFVRRRVEVQLDDGSTREAWTYEYNRPVHGLRRIPAWGG